MASRKAGMTELAARYAAALYELASDNKSVDQVADDLETIKRLLDASPDLTRLVRSPAISRGEQLGAMNAVMETAGVTDLVRRFVGVVANNRRLFALPAIITAFRNELARRRGEIRVTVAVARPLSEQQGQMLEDALKGSVGAKVNTTVTVDPDLLGGMVVRVGSQMIDNSLKTKIDRLQLAMKAPGGAL